MADRQELTRILREVAGGSPKEIDQLFQACYQELRRLARAYLARERRDHTLQTTALVHEAYLRLVNAPELEMQDRAHFMALSARAMRRILVDHARRRRRSKRSGRWQRVSMKEALDMDGAPNFSDLVALDLALTELQEQDPVQAKIVEMRFFGAMRTDEIAAALGVTDRTVRRHWAAAQVRLYKAMRG